MAPGPPVAPTPPGVARCPPGQLVRSTQVPPCAPAARSPLRSRQGPPRIEPDVAGSAREMNGTSESSEPSESSGTERPGQRAEAVRRLVNATNQLLRLEADLLH